MFSPYVRAEGVVQGEEVAEAAAAGAEEEDDDDDDDELREADEDEEEEVGAAEEVGLEDVEDDTDEDGLDDDDEEEGEAEATLSAGVIPPEAAEDVLEAATRAAQILAAAEDAWDSAYDTAEAKMPLKSTDELSSAEFSKLVMSPRRLERKPCPREAAVEGVPPCRRWMVTGEASAPESSASEIVADSFMLSE
ncbi:hypothetical protein JCM24511_07766 [Saitozyma sp. JCM 24511]|nr:hypothetical protein JCM24511_07766 [Saitozyma sp. JCM 24511]